MRTVTGATSGFYKPGRGRKARWVALAAMAFAAAIWFVWPDVEQARGSSLGPLPHHVCTGDGAPDLHRGWSGHCSLPAHPLVATTAARL